MKPIGYLKVGLFFLTMGAAGTTYIVMSTDGFNKLNTKDYEVVMEDAMGLTTNSKVYVAGVPVGKIDSIELTDGEATLKIAFLKNVEIRGDAVLSRKSASILGTSILVLTPGTDQAPVLKEGGRIQSEKGKGDLSSVVDSAQALSVQLAEILKDFQTRQMELLAVSLQTFNSIAAKLDARSDEELDRVTRILESTALITERFERALGEKEGNLDSSAVEIRIALENLRAITDEIRGGEGNVGRAIYDEQLYDSLLATAKQTEEAAAKLQTALESVNTLAVNADTVVKDAGVIVSRVTGLGVQVDPEVRYDMLASGFRAGASLRLEPRTKDRWYRIGVVSVPDGIATRTVTETSSGGGAATVTDTTETKFGVAIDAELARRIGAVTLRGGMLENTAGVGVDVQPVKWMKISGEVFDFKAGVPPNLKGEVTLYPFFDPQSDKPWNWLYLTGGVTAALDSRRDYFIGGGLRFADEEARGLVGLIPFAGK